MTVSIALKICKTLGFLGDPYKEKDCFVQVQYTNQEQDSVFTAGPKLISSKMNRSNNSDYTSFKINKIK